MKNWIRFEVIDANVDLDKLYYNDIVGVKTHIDLDDLDSVIEYIQLNVDFETDTKDSFEVKIYDVEFYGIAVEFTAEIKGTNLASRVFETEEEMYKVCRELNEIFIDVRFEPVIREKDENGGLLKWKEK